MGRCSGGRGGGGLKGLGKRVIDLPVRKRGGAVLANSSTRLLTSLREEKRSIMGKSEPQRRPRRRMAGRETRKGVRVQGIPL